MVEGGLLECCLQRRVPRRLLARDPFQCSVEWRVGAAPFIQSIAMVQFVGSIGLTEKLAVRQRLVEESGTLPRSSP